MAGEAFTRVFTYINGPIGSPDVTDIFPEATKACCYTLTALASADVLDERPLINDFHRYHRPFRKSTKTVSLFLTKPFDSGFVDKALDDDIHGEFFPLGYFIDEKLRNYISYKLDWRLILDLYGIDTYQVKIIETFITGDPETSFDIPFCLKAYSTDLAAGTIRMTTLMSGTIADRYNLSEDISFPEGFSNQIRVEGLFGYNTDEIEINSTNHNDKSLNDYENRITPIFKMRIGPVLEFVHEFIRNDVRQANRVTVTDYNGDNPNHHNETPVAQPSAYEPEQSENSLLYTVEFDWKFRFTTGVKDFCIP